MSDMKFTPGQWEVRVEQIAPGSNETCFTVATDEFDVVSPLLGIRNEWDAELIAAAPMMADYIKARADDGDIEAKKIWEVATNAKG